MCCQSRIPVSTIREYLRVNSEDMKKHIRALRIQDTVQPLFCPNPDCEYPIDSLPDLVKKGAKRACVECRRCKISVCTLCQQVWHIKECPPDDMWELMRECDIRRCPFCGQTTMKDGGCDHMICGRCGKDYYWTAKGGTTMSPELYH